MKTKARSAGAILSALLLISVAVSGCNGDNSSQSNATLTADHAPGSTLQPGTPDSVPTPSPTVSPTPTPTGNANTITLGVKYVALKNAAADADSPTQAEVLTLLQNMSAVWSQCDIQFVLEDYSAPVASDVGLAFYPANQSQLEADRAQFDDRKHALYVKTGTWNRTGDLGADGSNGFSTLPPANPEGTVFEAWVATNTLLLSHETGHLIGGLGHTSDTTNLMNHFVSTSTTQLTQSQCDEARATIKQYHSAWMR